MSKLYTIEDMLCADKHTDVMDIILSAVDNELFDVVTTPLWTTITPKKLYEYMPMLNAHTDTVHKLKPLPDMLLVTDSVITSIDGGIGADDRAGCYIIYNLLLNNCIDYMYVITDKEECGGIGGKDFAQSGMFSQLLPNVSVFIGLDRRGGTDCASYGYDNEEVFEYLHNVGYEYAYGSFTDVMTFAGCSDISCINLSIGYYNEHTKHESLNTVEMNNTLHTLQHVLPSELWDKQYKHKGDMYSRYATTTYDYLVDEIPEPVLCDVCGEHNPLYDMGWGNVCSKCLEDY